METENIKAREIQQNFRAELEALLKKYGAEIAIEYEGHVYIESPYVEVQFEYNVESEVYVPSIRI